MDVRLDEEQTLLFETAARIGRSLGTDTVHGLEHFDDAKAWQNLADSGFLASFVPESAGGMGAGVVEVALIAEAFGRSTAAVPFLGSAVLATALLVSSGADRRVLERLGDGSLRLAVGFDSSLSRIAMVNDDSAVGFDAAGATAVLVVDDDGALVAVSTEDGDAMDGVDLTRALVGVRPSAARRGVSLGGLGSVDSVALEGWMVRCLPVIAADLVGVMDGGLALAVGYACDRRQFGVPIGSFQAVQHLCADQKVSLEAARSAVWYAAWAAGHRDGREALIAARTAKAFSSTAGRAVTEAVVQVHGGIGITWECAAHIFLKRALLSRQLLGDEHEQMAALAELRYGKVAP